MDMAEPIEVRVLAYEADGLWIAQCLEYDIVTHSETFEELPEAVDRAIGAYLCANLDMGREGLDGIPSAPVAFIERFEHAQQAPVAHWLLSGEPACENAVTVSAVRVAKAA